MIKGVESLVLFSENAKNLAKFYEEKIGLKLTLEAEAGEEGEELYGFEFDAGPGLYIMDHSEVKGKSSESKRIIFNLEVDNIEEMAKQLKEKGVNVVQEVYHMQSYGLIATFEDIDGNYFQLVQVRESA